MWKCVIGACVRSGHGGGRIMGRRVLIIGAGASGMMAAIHAARAGAEVTLLEHKDRVGKKILSTGNGRCNLTNLRQKAECYRCGVPGFSECALGQFGVRETLDFFRRLGIVTKDRNGYVYPNSDQASSVVEALAQEMECLSVKVRCQWEVRGAVKEEGDFLVSCGSERYRGEALILAAGSRAAPATGSDGSGYELAASFGHRIITPLPALVQLRCKEKHYKRLAGVRSDGEIRLYVDGRQVASDTGELQLTDYGISGIPVFQVSRHASVALHRRQKVKAVIDFLPSMSLREAWDMLERRFEFMEGRTCGQFMNGLLNSKLSGVLLELAGIAQGQTVQSLDMGRKKRLFQLITAYETQIEAANPYEHAQACCGGVDVRQVREKTLESRLVRGLYFCGEILDVDGICGGYNLQWAWSSGAVAGKCAAGRRADG